MLSFADTGLRAGATIQATEIPKRTRERDAGPDSEADQHTGEDLVPESTVQEQTRPDRGRREAAGAEHEESALEEDRRADSHQGRQAQRAGDLQRPLLAARPNRPGRSDADGLQDERASSQSRFQVQLDERDANRVQHQSGVQIGLELGNARQVEPERYSGQQAARSKFGVQRQFRDGSFIERARLQSTDQDRIQDMHEHQ